MTGARLSPRSGILRLDGLGQQSFYDRLSLVQNDLNTVGAGVAAVGKDLWDTIAGEVHRSGTLPDALKGVGYFSGYDWIFEEITRALNSTFPSVSHKPGESDIALAQQRVREFRTFVDYVKSVAPEVQKKVADDMAWMAAKTAQITHYQDPDEVGWEAFKEAAAERAEEIVGKFASGFGIGTAAIIAAAVIAVIAAISLGGKK